ncbi:MAG: hypothetical protein ACREGF_00655, partial [Candidatus Saccharimonadales bacterium]
EQIVTVCPIRNIECSGMATYDYMRDVQRDAVISIDEVEKTCGDGMQLFEVQGWENPSGQIPRFDCAFIHFVVQEALGSKT